MLKNLTRKEKIFSFDQTFNQKLVANAFLKNRFFD